MSNKAQFAQLEKLIPALSNKILAKAAKYAMPKGRINLSTLNARLKQFEASMYLEEDHFIIGDNPILFAISGHHCFGKVGLVDCGDRIVCYNLKSGMAGNPRSIAIVKDCQAMHPRLAYLLGIGPKYKVDSTDFLEFNFYPSPTAMARMDEYGLKYVMQEYYRKEFIQSNHIPH